jgi:hypothetical protein
MLHPVMRQWVAAFTNSNEGKESSHLSMPNGLDRSCEATIYPVLDKPRNSEALGPRGRLLKEIYPLVFKIPFTIRLDRR